MEAFGNKATTIGRLRSGNSNKTDIEGAVLQYNNMHMAVCTSCEVLKTLDNLKNSPATVRQKAKFILATDGDDFQAEEPLYITLREWWRIVSNEFRRN